MTDEPDVLGLMRNLEDALGRAKHLDRISAQGERIGLVDDSGGGGDLALLHRVLFARVAADAGLAPEIAWSVAGRINQIATETVEVGEPFAVVELVSLLCDIDDIAAVLLDEERP